MNEKLNFAKARVYEAADLIKSLMKEHVSISAKSAFNDLVTNVDKQVESFLVEAIQNEYPDHGFLTEEETEDSFDTDDVWIIDPIDGTVNFVYERRNFAISVGFYHQKRPVFGIVYDVIADEMFVGITGQGAYLNDKRLELAPQTQTLQESIVFGDLNSFSLYKEDIQTLNRKFVAHRYLGAASLEICGVACNRHQVYVSSFLKTWDVAAAVIVLQEVQGAWLFGEYDNGIFFSSDDGIFVSTSNADLMLEMKALMKAYD